MGKHFSAGLQWNCGRKGSVDSISDFDFARSIWISCNTEVDFYGKGSLLIDTTMMHHKS